MSFSQQNKRLNEEPEYRYAFLTTKKGNSIKRRMFMHSITLIIASIARLFSFSEKKLLKSEIIVVPLLTASKFELYFFGDYKVTHFL